MPARNKPWSRKNRLDYSRLEQKQMLSANIPSQDEQLALTRDHLASQPETEYLFEGRSDIELIEIKHGLASTTTRFQQTVDGLPIYDAVITLNQGHDGEFQLVHHELAFDTSQVQFPEPNNKLEVAASEAESIAMAQAGFTEASHPARIELGWYVDTDGVASQVWDMTVYNYYGNVGDYVTVVDVSSGDVVLQENRGMFANGSGFTYVPNPHQTQGNALGLIDADDATNAFLDEQRVSVTLERLNDDNFLLIGDWVDLATLNSGALADVDADEPTRVYNYDRSDPRFEQVVIYHTVDQINEYFHQLGFDDDSGVPNGIRDYPTLANAHWDNADQSFYSGGNDAIHFGDGGVDDGEDADIVAHEYGHAIQNNQNAAWGGGEMGAMGEGFGDYLAAAFFKQSGDPSHQALHAAAVGEWDASSYSFDDPPNLRRVDGTKMYPFDLVGQVHADGEIWSRALWDLNANVGGDYANQLILEHHFTLGANATMAMAAQAILQANENFNPDDPTANYLEVYQPFAARGILPNQLLVQFEASTYEVGDAITVVVADANAATDATITLTSDNGDTEVVQLTRTSSGLLRGTITTGTGLGTPGDGEISILQSSNTITATYNSTTFEVGEATTLLTSEVITGTPGDDIIVVQIGSPFVTVTVNGESFEVPTSQGSYSIDALSGTDTITIHSDSGDDLSEYSQGSILVNGTNFDFAGTNVEIIRTFGGGGNDIARMFGSNRSEVFRSFNSGAGTSLNGNNIDFIAHDYARVNVFGNGGTDTAFLADSAGNDRLYSTTVYSNIATTESVVNVRDFSKISVHATQGGYDIASMVGSDGADFLYADDRIANLKSETGDEVVAVGFDRVWVDGRAGTDTGSLVGSAADDIFSSTPTNSYLYATGYFNQAVRFENVTAISMGGTDQAILQDSPGDDNYYAAPTHAVLYSANSRVQANGFSNVSAIGTAGFDRAAFVDSAGDDRYVARPNSAFMQGEGYLNYAQNFNGVSGRSTFGNDVAYLHASQQDDFFFGSKAKSFLTGSTFFNQAFDFGNVTAYLSSAGHDVATFEDSRGDDTFVGLNDRAVLYDDEYLVFTTGSDLSIAKALNGGTDSLATKDIEFEIRLNGDWT